MPPEEQTTAPSDDIETAIESMDSSTFLSGVDATADTSEPVDSPVVDAKDDEITDQPEEVEQPTEPANGDDTGDDKPLTDAQRNAYFAQRRIAAKQNTDKFVESLREEAEDYIEEVDESKFENMDEEQAEILRNAQKQSRQMEVTEAIRETERVRESTANSIFMAESQLPEFNPNDKEHYVGDELYGEAMSDWAAANAIIEHDKNGEPQIVGVKKGAPSPYEFLEKKAAQFRGFSQKLQARAQTNVARNNAAHEITPVQASGHEAGSLEDLEARVGDISLT